MFQKLKTLWYNFLGLMFYALVAVHFLAVPCTFVYIMTGASGWTVLNCLPRIVIYTLLSAGWFVYWPIHLLKIWFA